MSRLALLAALMGSLPSESIAEINDIMGANRKPHDPGDPEAAARIRAERARRKAENYAKRQPKR
jgi:hypothetical protein